MKEIISTSKITNIEIEITTILRIELLTGVSIGCPKVAALAVFTKGNRSLLARIFPAVSTEATYIL